MEVADPGLTLLFTVLYHAVVNTHTMPHECLKCELSSAATEVFVQTLVHHKCENTERCLPGVPKNCKKVQVNASSFEVDEGAAFFETCVHNLPVNLSLTFQCYIIEDPMTGQNHQTALLMIIQKVTMTGSVQSFNSTTQDTPMKVHSGESNLIVLLICVLGAVILILLLAVIMKIMLRRREAQNKARRRQRQEEMQSTDTTATTVTTYW